MYIVIGGGGKIGETLARQLLSVGHEVVVIEQDPALAESLSRQFSGRYMIVEGDCCDAGAMAEAGMADADIFVVVTGHDDDNLVACEVARTLYRPARIIARVNNPKNERIFQKLDIEAISSTTVIARMIEEEAMSTQMRTVMSLRKGEFKMIEVELPRSTALRASGGVRVSDVTLPASTILVAIIHEGEFDVVGPSSVLQAGDTVLVCTKSSLEGEVRHVLLDL